MSKMEELPTLAYPLVDSHAHLDSGRLQGDLAEVLQRARQAGVSHMLTIGCDLDSSAQSVQLAETYPQVFAAVGIHPHDAQQLDDSVLERLRHWAQHPRVVALGEMGLDYNRNYNPADIQKQAFAQQLQLAIDLDMPVIIHNRDANDDVLAMLQHYQHPRLRGILHCFSGDAHLAKACLELGFYISFAGPLTYPKNEALREAARSVPAERLLVETDCPYLAPQKFRGKRNEPAYVRYTAAALAEAKGLSLNDIARITTRNLEQLLGLNLLPAQGDTLAYPIRDSLYLNITNRCTNACRFCVKHQDRDFTVKGHPLKLSQEPTAQQLISAIGDQARQYREVVFCGLGEPLLRLELVLKVCDWLKQQGACIRINTDGLANLVHGRNILPELQGRVDELSISLNTPDAASYGQLCPNRFGAETAFSALCDFIRQAGQYVPQVTATAVTYPGVDIAACAQLADQLGADFRSRLYNDVG